VYPIIEKRFISEVINYTPTSLGKTERRFLGIIAVSDESAYRLCAYLKKGEEPISYKNVRKTLLSLLSKGLIEETGEKLPHGAKKYRLTPHGLFQCLLNVRTIPRLLKKEYQNSLLMNNILYQFFDTDTLSEFLTIPRIQFIGSYLNNCCMAILGKVVEFHASKFDDKIYFLFDDMNRVIRKEILHLVFEIVISSNLKTLDFRMTDDNGVEFNRRRYLVGEDDVREGQDNKHLLTLFPNMKLKNDNKFMKIFSELKKDFDEGCMNFI
jgi:DNA-binding PadR family transcriptional regulator